MSFNCRVCGSNKIKNILNLGMQLWGNDFIKIFFNKNKYTGAKSKNLSTKKIKNLLPDYNLISFVDGLK